MKSYQTDGVITERGTLAIRDRDAFVKAMAQLPQGEYWITVERKKAKRSLDQNAYWWAVPVKILAEHCGYTENQMHYALLGECFGYTSGLNGRPMPVKPSSSDLSVEEFTHLIDWCLTWAAAELGVIIPNPNEVAA